MSRHAQRNCETNTKFMALQPFNTTLTMPTKCDACIGRNGKKINTACIWAYVESGRKANEALPGNKPFLLLQFFSLNTPRISFLSPLIFFFFFCGGGGGELRVARAIDKNCSFFRTKESADLHENVNFRKCLGVSLVVGPISSSFEDPDLILLPPPLVH